VINRYTFAGLLAVLGVFGLGALVYYLAQPAKAPKPPPVAAATPAPDAAATATGTASATPRASAKPPPQRTKNLAEAARLAGCNLVNPRDEGREHVTRTVTPEDYGTNPPTSGIHAPEWAPDAAYPPGATPDLGTLVHTLEHGRINIQYRPGTDATTIAALNALAREMDDGYHLLLYENATGMPFAVAATAWDHLLGCPAMNDRVFDAIRAFRETYIDHAPETIP
jgi:hypothetical protein